MNLSRLFAAGLVLAGLLGSRIGADLARATEIPAGPVSGVWNLEGSPYTVLGDIVVPAGQALVLDPGVEVTFAGNYRLTVQGTVSAIGTASSRIRISGVVRWGGIRFENVNGTSTLGHCEVFGADQGISSVNAPVDLTECLLADHVTAVHIFGIGDTTPAVVRIDRCVIRQCRQHGIFIVENSNARVTGCEITQCALDGSARGAVQLSNQSPQGLNDPLIEGNWIHDNTWQGLTAFDVTGAGRIHPTVVDNTIERNYTGIYLLYTSGVFRRNRITDNYQSGNPDSGAGVMVYGGASRPVFTENTMTGNYTGFYIVQGAAPNLGDLSNGDPADDGGNRISGNLDPDGDLWSVYSNSTAAIKAENNIWDSTDPGVIATTIFDGHDNPAYGLVDFEPILDPAAVDGAFGPGAPVMDNGRVRFGPCGPSPFSGTTRLELLIAGSAAEGGPAALAVDVFDTEGRRVRSLLGGTPHSGAHRLVWDGTDDSGAPVPSGTYLVRIAAGDQRASRKIVLAR